MHLRPDCVEGRDGKIPLLPPVPGRETSFPLTDPETGPVGTHSARRLEGFPSPRRSDTTTLVDPSLNNCARTTLSRPPTQRRHAQFDLQRGTPPNLYTTATHLSLTSGTTENILVSVKRSSVENVLHLDPVQRLIKTTV